MANPVSSGSPSRHDLLDRIRALEAECDRLRAAAQQQGREHDRELSTAKASVDATERRLAGILDVIADAHVILDPEFRYTYVNPAAERALGKPIGDLLGRSHWEVFPASRDADVGRAYRRVVTEGVAVHLRQHYPWEGYDAHLEVDAYPTTRGGVAVFWRDVTERVRAEQALRESEAKYRTLFESIDEGFCVIQVLFDGEDHPVDYRFLEGNPAWEKHTGLHGALGKTAREVLPELEEHWFQIYGEVALTGEPVRFQNGSEVMQRWFDVFAFRVGDPGERKVALLFNDITERKQSERERERLLLEAESARAEAEAANRSKSEFLAIMSHELRTPLNAICGYADLLEMELHGPVTGAQRKALSRIRTSQQHLLGLINDVLNYAKIETGSVHYDLRELRVADLLASVEALVEPQVRKKNLSLTIHDAPADLGACADPEKVRQILVNLLSNAIKFTGAGGRITLACEPHEERVHITVRDTGIGIAADRQESIFEPFVQVRSDLTRSAEGTGLGLAISRDLARGMGGDLVLRSREGEGSTFTLMLPRAGTGCGGGVKGGVMPVGRPG